MKVNLLMGRFQPFTLGHMKCVEAAAAKGLKTVIAQVETKSSDKKHPFTDNDLEQAMKDLVSSTPDIVDVIKVKNANIVTIGEMFVERGYEIASWTCGTDRIDSYTKMSSKKILVDFIKELDKIFKAEGLGEYSTIEDWKVERFRSWCEKNADWLLTDPEIGGIENTLFDRWFNSVKTTNLRELKKHYQNHLDQFVLFDKKEYKKIVSDVMEPLDTFFGKLGNAIIKQCDGIINAGIESEVIDQLRADIEDVVKDVHSNGSTELNDKLSHQLNRLAKLGDEINPVEGIVFRYKGKLMKCTGSFACTNQILGSIKFSRKN